MRPAMCPTIAAPLVTALLLAATPARALPPNPPRYRAVLLAPAATAWDVNESNEAVGALGEHRIDYNIPQGFLWREGQVLEIGGQFTWARAINDSGHIAGTDWENYQAFLHEGTYTGLGGNFTEGWGLNNFGIVVGAQAWDFGSRASMWDGGWTDLAQIGEQDGRANDINDQFDIAGFDEDDLGRSQPVIWHSGGSPTQLSLPIGYIRGMAWAVNDSDQVVGQAGFLNSTPIPTACLWDGGSLSPLPGTNAAAYDITNAGVIVGEADGAAALWWPSGAGHQLHPLGSLVDNLSVVGALFAAWGINECGTIVGEATNGAFMLIPDDTTDTDRDGLTDQWELCGIDADFDGIVDFRPDSANPLHMDLYVEIDAMAGMAVSPEAVQDVKDAFAAVPNGDLPQPNPDGMGGITLHVLVDETDLPDETWQAPPAWPNRFDVLKAGYFGTEAERGHANSEDILAARAMAYRYCIWARSFMKPDSGFASGAAEVGGNDFFVALDPDPWNGGTRNQQAATFMHELGHTLGLTHGGAPEDTTVNHKTNYYSIMNYAWQFDSSTGGECFWTDDWVLDFSHDQNPALDEANLSEVQGISGAPGGIQVPFSDGGPQVRCATLGQGNVDLDGDGNVSAQAVALDLNHIDPADPPTPGQVLQGWDDWAHVDLVFRDDDEYADGAHASADRNQEMTDRQFRALFGGGSAAVPPGPRPQRLNLSASPNPAREFMYLAFDLPAAGRVQVAVHDLQGKRVAQLLDGERAAGRHVVTWQTGRGRPARAGVYFATVTAGGVRVTRKVAVVK